ncbi:glucitol operon repressor [Antarctobacter heliothermus]|uniref:Glucitol operon repressor n=1 Tax=Antarctobacter heliothermus TaxID=74033 RepID=A0A222E1C9_9RHOB|nr:DeoR/GlpR family DNA-binding transcription regulator [Antarctobacter heliothermus]ASP20025.1 glucitol operon repressor [Antarctobacter heliothermus]
MATAANVFVACTLLDSVKLTGHFFSHATGLVSPNLKEDPMTASSAEPQRSLTSSERHDCIVELLQSRAMVTIADLADRFGVSAVTVRSDLAALERRQLLRRVRGGAIAVHPARFERPTDLTRLNFTEEKKRIGAAAALRVRDGDTIILDSGSTTLAMASALPHTLTDVVVLTNCLDIALTLQDHPGVAVIVTGGLLRKSSGRDVWHTLVPPLATLLLKEVNADTAYLSCTGIDVNAGFTNGNWEEAELKKVMIAAARKVVFLADHAKVGHIGSARIASLSQASALVSDSQMAAAAVEELEGTGLNVTLA